MHQSGSRKDKTPGKPPPARTYNVTRVTPRMIAYAAAQVRFIFPFVQYLTPRQLRHSLTAKDWDIRDNDFNYADFFDGLVALFCEPLTPWARNMLGWWNLYVGTPSTRTPTH